MIAMLLAATTLAAAAPTSVSARPVVAEPTPNAFREPAYCRDAANKVVNRYGQPLTEKLGDLPPGALQLAVDRRIDGCRVITVVRGNVLPDQPDPAAEGYRLMPLIKAPPKREDAPSNRR